MKKIVLVGGGGHCKSCIDVLVSSARYAIYGIVDANLPVHDEILSYKILGSDELLPELLPSVNHAAITVGHVANPQIKIRLYKHLKDIGFLLPTIASISSVISRYAQYDEGNQFMHMSCVNSATALGKCNIINTKALIEHDCIIGDFNHLSTGAIINGSVTVGNRCYIGSGTVIFNNLTICDDVVLGAGSLVTKSITKPGVYWGSPARYIRGTYE